MKAKIRFRQQDIKGLASHILEIHQAEYGGLLFDVTKRKKEKRRHWPGPGIIASVTFGNHGDDPTYYAKVKTIQDGKFWCRATLCYILRGVVPFGDHSEEGE